ncbi:DUF6049 family protein [Kribbella solani]|uniref:Uncharacterized protein n=1 Tax=Kribbella solani TaxID=236067 RepID=A0A841E3Q6_9ACTN|nr:hypothetical protein [Kribbella solani]
MFRRRLRLPAVLGAGLLVAASAATVAAPAEAAPGDDPVVQVSIDGFSPSVPKPGQPVVIKGTVTNTSSVTFADPQVLACIDRTRLASTSALDAIPTEQNIPMDKRDSCGNLTNDPQTFKPFERPLAPKETVAFALTVPWKEWRISDHTGVYVVGVGFRGQPPNSERIAAGRSRTLMPVAGKEPLTRTVNTALVIPLLHRPTQLGGKNFANESLAKDLGPTGALGRSLMLGRQHRVTWLVDPAMLDEIRQLAKGYVVVSQNGQTTTGTGQVAAINWLKEFDASRAHGNEVVLLPYGDPDVASLLEAGGQLKDMVRQARTRTERFDLGSTGFANGLWLEGGAAASRYLGPASTGFPGATAEDLNLVSSSSWPAAKRPVLTTTPVYNLIAPESPDQAVRTVVADSSLTAGGPDADAVDTPLQVRQRFAAVTALLAASGGGQGASSVVALPPRGWDTDGTATAALANSLTLPWLKATDLSSIANGNQRPRTMRAPAPEATNGILTENQLTSVGRLANATSTMQKLLVDEAALPEVMSQALLRSASAGWNGYPEESRQFAAIELGSVNKQLGSVRLVNAKVDKGLRKEIKVNLAGSKGTFPLTIANDTEWSVRVGIVVKAVNRTDLKIETPETVVLPPHGKWTPRINASAEQNGLIRADAQVVNADGQPIGKSQELLIQASQYGSVGWVLVGAACALLFGTSFVRIYRRVRSERRNPAAAEAATQNTETGQHAGTAQGTESTETAGIAEPELPGGAQTPDPAHGRSEPDGVPEAATPDASLKEGVGSKDG